MYFDFLLFAIFAAVTWAVASGGLWDAALMVFNVTFAGLVAMNFWEPLADWLEKSAPPLAGYADGIVVLVLFTVALLAIRTVVEYVSPGAIRFPGTLYFAGRWLFGAWTAALVVGFVATVWQMAPLSETFMGVDPSKRTMFGLGPDRYWLAFTQRTSRYILDREPAVPFDLRPLPPTAAGQPVGGADFIVRYATRRAVYRKEITGPSVPGFSQTSQ